MSWEIADNTKSLITFRNSGKTLKKVMEISGMRNKEQLSASVTVVEEYYKKLHDFFEFHPEFGFAQTHSVFMTDMGYHCSITVDGQTQQDVLTRFLLELHRFDPFVGEVLGKIKAFLSIVEYETVGSNIESVLNESGFDTALSNVHEWYNQGCRSAFVILAKLCFEKALLQECVRALNRIPEQDTLSHFEAARLLINCKQKDLALKHLFKAGDDPVVQDLRDKLWAEEVSADPSQVSNMYIQGIKTNDARSLIAINEKIRSLKEETTEQEDYIQNLEKQLKELEEKRKKLE